MYFYSEHISDSLAPDLDRYNAIELEEDANEITNPKLQEHKLNDVR